MKNLIFIITLCGLVMVSCNKYSIPNSIQSVPSEYTNYPNWYVPKIQLNYPAVPGEEYHWRMSYKGSNNKESFPDSALLVIPAIKGEPVHIQVESQRGNPAIAVFDRHFHKNDIYALINPFGEDMDFPGSAKSHAIGSDGKVGLCYTPRFNGVHFAWIWLLNGDLKEPDPFESVDYDDLIELYDTAGMGMPFTMDESMLKMMMTLDSLSSLDTFRNAWDNQTRNSENFTRSKVDVTIEAGSCSDNLAQDYYYELYKTFDISQNLLLGAIQTTDELEAWYAILEKHDSLRSMALGQAREWNNLELSFKDNPFGLSPEESLKAWVNNPLVQAELLKRKKYYSMYTEDGEEEIIKEWLYGTMRGEFDILLNDLSLMLSQKLSKAGAVSGALYDLGGYLVAASQPFSVLNVKESVNWDQLENTNSDVFHSGCYSWNGMNTDLEKVYFPIRNGDDNAVIGWLMVEMYCKE
ncbi:MAG: hypothetical protein GY790_13015 [Bacteroidetes bacterium]|nr:hypothetical protein [Bacteroidota bacterium]